MKKRTLFFLIFSLSIHSYATAQAKFSQNTVNLSDIEQEKVSEFLQKTLIYPEESINSEVQALITLSYAVGNYGEVSEVIVEYTSVSHPEGTEKVFIDLLNNEAERAVTNLPHSIFNKTKQRRTIKQSLLFKLNGDHPNSFNPNYPAHTVIVTANAPISLNREEGTENKLDSILTNSSEFIDFTELVYKLTGKIIEEQLIVVDGVISDNNRIIRSDKIASVSILKGENAIKSYGEAGKNGAIEISTRKK